MNYKFYKINSKYLKIQNFAKILIKLVLLALVTLDSVSSTKTASEFKEDALFSTCIIRTLSEQAPNTWKSRTRFLCLFSDWIVALSISLAKHFSEFSFTSCSFNAFQNLDTYLLYLEETSMTLKFLVIVLSLFKPPLK